MKKDLEDIRLQAMYLHAEIAMRRALKRITKDEANRFNRKIYNATFSAIKQHITTPLKHYNHDYNCNPLRCCLAWSGFEGRREHQVNNPKTKKR